MTDRTQTRITPRTLLALLGVAAGAAALVLVAVRRRVGRQGTQPAAVITPTVTPPAPVRAAPAQVTETDTVAGPAPQTLPTRTAQTQTNRRQYLSAAAALILLGLCVLRLQPSNTNGDLTRQLVEALLLFVPGVVALCAAVNLAGKSGQRWRLPALSTAAVTVAPLRWQPLTVGLVSLTLLVAGTVGFVTLAHHVQIGLLLYGALTVTLGIIGRQLHLVRAIITPNRLDTALVLLVTLVAVILRLWQLEQGVFHYIDEAHMAQAVADLHANTGTRLLLPFNEFAVYPWLYAYVQAHTVALLEPGLLALRLPGALMGALTVAAVYLLARGLFDRRTAVIAALLLATFPPHVHLSRLGLIHNGDPLFTTLGLAALAWGFRSGRGVYFPLAGLLLGLSQYFYEGGRLLTLGVIAAWLIAVAMSQPRKFWRQRPVITRFLVTFALVALPLYVSWALTGTSFTAWLDQFQLRESAPETIGGLVNDHLLPPLLTYFQHPPSGPYYSIGADGTALLLVFVAPFFLLGTVYCLYRWRAMGAALVGIWWLLNVLGASLLLNNVWSPRYFASFPAVAIMVAVGVVAAWRLLGVTPDAPAKPDLRRRVLAALPVLVAVALAAGQVVYYFGVHLPAFNLHQRPHPDHFDAFERALDLPRATEIYLLDEDANHHRFDDLATLNAFYASELDFRIIPPGAVTADWLESELSDAVHYAFFVAPGDTEIYALLRQRFVLLHPPQVSDNNVPPDRQYVLYEIGRTRDRATSATPEDDNPTTMIVAAGVAAGIMALFVAARPKERPPKTKRPRFTHWLVAPELVALYRSFNWLALNTGIIFLIYLVLVNVRYFAFDQHGQFLLLVGGMVLVTVGVVGKDAPYALRGMKRTLTLSLLVAAVPLTAVTLLALALRAWNLEYAIHMPIDEYHMQNAVVDLLEDPYITLLRQFDPIARFTWIFPYLQSFGVRWFGPTLTGMRVISVVFGTLTVPALYWLARELFRRRDLALIAALLLATFPPHLHFSRLGLLNSAGPLFGVLAYAALANGFRTGSNASFALAGAMLGATQYFYEGGRLLYPLLALVWVVLLWLTQANRLRWAGLRRTLLVFALTAAPLYVVWQLDNQAFAPRIQQTIDKAFTIDLLPPLLHFFTAADPSLFYGGETALLLWFVSPLWVIGLGVCLVCWRSVAAPLLLPWVALTVAANSVLIFPNWTPRFIVLFPGIMLLVTWGIAELSKWLGLLVLTMRKRKKTATVTLPGAQSVPVMLIAVVIAAAQANYYFRVHIPYYNHQIRAVDYKDFVDAYYRAQLLDPNTQFYLIAPVKVQTEHWDTLNRINRHGGTPVFIKYVYRQNLTDQVLNSLDPRLEYGFFVPPEDIGLLNQLRRHLDLSEPQFGPFDVSAQQQYALVTGTPRTTDSGADS